MTRELDLDVDQPLEAEEGGKMPKIDQETAMMARAWGVLQGYNWRRHKAWGKVGEAVMFLIISGTVLITFVLIAIGGYLTIESLGILVFAATFLFLAYWNISTFRRVHNRYFITFHTLKGKQMDVWIDRVLREKGIGFSKVPSSFLQRQSMKASLVCTYQLEGHVTSLYLVDGAAQIYICLGPAREANKAELKELMSLITASLVRDQRRILEMAMEDEKLFKEDLGEQLIILASGEGACGAGDDPGRISTLPELKMDAQ